jgi:hypothetical protein
VRFIGYIYDDVSSPPAGHPRQIEFSESGGPGSLKTGEGDGTFAHHEQAGTPPRAEKVVTGEEPTTEKSKPKPDSARIMSPRPRTSMNR